MLRGGCPLWTEHPCWAFVPHHPLCLPRQPHAFISPVGVSVKTARPKEQSVRAHPGTVQDLEFLGGGRSHSSASDPPQHVWPCRRTGKGEVQGADGLPTQIGLWKRKYHYSVVPKPQWCRAPSSGAHGPALAVGTTAPISVEATARERVGRSRWGREVIS